MKKCGLIFNRHRWRNLTDKHRICEKCGTMGYYSYEGEGWLRESDYDDFMISVTKWKAFIKKTEASQRKALKKLQNP